MGERTKPSPPRDRRKAPGKTVLTTRVVYITRGFALVHCTATLDVPRPVVELLSRLRTPPSTSSTNLFRHALRRTSRSTARPDQGVQRCFPHRRLADSWPVSVDGGTVLFSTQRDGKR